ncbi:hypothetical protein ZIOFF_048776 [Zingiber officinale]|uniref:NAC domain-containing protein n=1 Tax=Zingiber officinale TaxID=94328 RepID=A0A8J5KWZ1_ZINOF|nr:hypothetical protein ZIOFF_048776 [Zingiber officinale]
MTRVASAPPSRATSCFSLRRSKSTASRFPSFPSPLPAYPAQSFPLSAAQSDGKVATSDWPGFPAGVKFDPSDVELLEHLAARIGLGNSKPHVLIDEFIPTLEDDAGICYTHPQNLPGAEKDGSGSAHFFHRISSAYAKGPRKRRRISRCGSSEEPAVRWHKTGRTKLVLDINGVQKGWKKIMVLHESSKGVAKPDRAKWVMHQYHIGAGEDESEGQLVVSKVFYQRIQSRNPSTSSPRPLRRPEIGIESVSQAEYAFDSEVNGTNARGFADLDEILVDTPPDFQLSVRDLVRSCPFNDLKLIGRCLWVAACTVHLGEREGARLELLAAAKEVFSPSHTLRRRSPTAWPTTTSSRTPPPLSFGAGAVASLPYAGCRHFYLLHQPPSCPREVLSRRRERPVTPLVARVAAA